MPRRPAHQTGGAEAPGLRDRGHVCQIDGGALGGRGRDDGTVVVCRRSACEREGRRRRSREEQGQLSAIRGMSPVLFFYQVFRMRSWVQCIHRGSKAKRSNQVSQPDRLPALSARRVRLALRRQVRPDAGHGRQRVLHALLQVPTQLQALSMRAGGAVWRVRRRAIGG